MSEHMTSGNPTPTLDSLDNTGTLFDAAVDRRVEHIVDTGQADYHDARIMAGDSTPGWPMPNPEQVSVSLVDRYIDELHLLNTMAEMHMRSGLVNRNGDIEEVIEHYKTDVPKVVNGAKRNMDIGNQIIRSIYHHKELVDVGFVPQDLDDDIVKLKYEYRTEYMGPENKNKRTKRRAFLRQRIAELSPTETDT